MRYFNLVPILLLAMLAGCLDSSSSSGSDKKPDDSDNGSSSSPLENIAGIWELKAGSYREPVLISRSGKTTLGDASDVTDTSITLDGTRVGTIVSNSSIEFSSFTLSRTQANITAYTNGAPALADLADTYLITTSSDYFIRGTAVLAVDGSVTLNLEDYDFDETCSMTTQLERPYSAFNEYVASISDASSCNNVLYSDSYQVLGYYLESESKLYLHLYGDDDEPWLTLEVAD